MVLEAVTDVDNPPRTIDALAARVGRPAAIPIARCRR